MKANDLDPTRFRSAAAVGLRVFPVKPRDKKPAIAWKQFQDRAPADDELAQWDAGNFNVGIVCGEPSGVVVLDVDSAEAQELVDGLDLPPTPTVRTARGVHYYYRRPAFEIRNSVRIGGVKLDVRGDGGYVVGPGSVHQSGDIYRWIVTPEEVPFAAFPETLLALMQMRKRSTKLSSTVDETGSTAAPSGAVERWLACRLRDAKAELAKAVEGERNDTLFKVSVRLASHVAASEVEWAHFAAALTATAMQVGLDAEEIAATLDSAWKRGSAEPTEWLKVTHDWVWLAKPDVFYHRESGEHLKQEAFNKRFAKLRFKKVAFSRYLLENELIPMVHDLTYEPREPELYLERDGLTWLNTYQPSGIEPTEGDPAPFIDFIEYLVPEKAEREHLLQMVAWSVRNPGTKIRHALLFRSREQGIGKSMLTEIWGELLGVRNVRKTTTEEVSGNFQGFIKEKLLVVLEELNWGVGPTGYNRLKDLITSDVAVVNEKFMPVRHWPNYATFVILTNLPVPILIEDRDRRIFYIDSPAQARDKSYYREFVNWWRNNLGVIRAHLDAVDLSTFDPSAVPPMTAAKAALIAESQNDLVKELLLAIDQRWGVFDRDIVELEEIERQLGPSMRGKTRVQLIKALKDIGAVPFRQQRVHGRWVGDVFMTKPGRASLWAIRNPLFWTQVDARERSEEWARFEGLLARFHGLPAIILPGAQ